MSAVEGEGGSYHAVVRLFTSVGGGGFLATRKRGPATFWGSHNTSKRAGDRDTDQRISNLSSVTVGLERLRTVQ